MSNHDEDLVMAIRDHHVSNQESRQCLVMGMIDDE
jgi:hypothetical protein